MLTRRIDDEILARARASFYDCTLAVQTIIHFLRRIVSRKSHRGRLSRNANSRCRCMTQRYDPNRDVRSLQRGAVKINARARFAHIARSVPRVFSPFPFRSLMKSHRGLRIADRADAKVENYSFQRARAIL